MRWYCREQAQRTNNPASEMRIGLAPGETDSLAGEMARLYVGGISTYILKFYN